MTLLDVSHSAVQSELALHNWLRPKVTVRAFDHYFFNGQRLFVKTIFPNFSVNGYWSEQPPQIFWLSVIGQNDLLKFFSHRLLVFGYR